MKINILLFASYREQIGKRELQFEVPEETNLHYLARQITAKYPISLDSALCAINEHYAPLEKQVKDGDTVAFFPPVSGG